MLPADRPEPIVFFGSKSYLPLLARLTQHVKERTTVFYNSGVKPWMRGYRLQRFNTRTRTNWHYECANAFVDGELTVG